MPLPLRIAGLVRVPNLGLSLRPANEREDIGNSTWEGPFAVIIFTPVPFIPNLPFLSFVPCGLRSVKMHGKVLVFAYFNRLSWKELAHRMPEELGGQATLDDIYAKAEKHTRRLSVPTWMASIRRTLQETATPVARGVWRL